MRTVGLITEYNPFHNGHLYHLEESKRITSSNYSVAVMSGNFLQRGEPALVDKWTRVKMAIDSGVDLVLELPVIYSCQSAEHFSYGAIKILDALGIVDSICFGSELGKLGPLKYLADILIDEPSDYRKLLKEKLDRGLSYPQARSSALLEFLSEDKEYNKSELEYILNNPNNILALEYIKSLKTINSNIKPITIKRIVSHYNSKELSGTISSATSIRESILNTHDLDVIKNTVSPQTFNYLREFLDKHASFNNISNFNQILLYLIRAGGKTSLKNIYDIEDGLDNRILKCGGKYNTITDILKCMSTKRYPSTRLNRILIHLLIGLDGDTFNRLNKFGPQYIRVLGMNSNGAEMLKKAKKTTSLPIITKFADHKKLNNKLLNEMISFDKKASDIYFIALKKSEVQYNLDYTTSPYIKHLD